MAAAKLLEPLCKQEDGTSSPHMQSAVARIYLQGGYIEMAVKHFSAVVQDHGPVFVHFHFADYPDSVGVGDDIVCTPFCNRVSGGLENPYFAV